MKRLISLLLVLIVCLSLCGTALAESVLPISEEKVTLRVMATFSPIVENLKTNTATKWLEDRTNVHIEWDVTEWGSLAYQKMQLKLNSGQDLPDIMMGKNWLTDDSVKYSYGKDGLFIPLNDLIEKYGVNVKRLWAMDPSYKKAMTSPDGNIYALQSYVDIKHYQYKNKLWINQDWLDNLGLPMPQTTDELVDTLRAFKEDDPNRNGKQDEVPLSGPVHEYYNYILNSFITVPENNSLCLLDGEGNVVFPWNTTAFKDGCNFLYKLMDEGLVDPNIYDYDPSSWVSFAMGDSNCLGITGSLDTVMPTTSAQSQSYVGLNPVEGPDGVRSVTYNPPGLEPGGDLFITRDCKNPEIAFQWADYLMSAEVYYRLYFGEEGVDFAYPEEGAIGLNGKPAKIVEINEMYSLSSQNRAWMWMTPIINDGVNDGSVFSGDTSVWSYRIYNESVVAYEPYKTDLKYVLPSVVFTPEEQAQFKQLKNDIFKQVNAMRDECAMGLYTADSKWDSYLSKLDEVGLKDYIALVQMAYDRQYKTAE